MKERHGVSLSPVVPLVNGSPVDFFMSIRRQPFDYTVATAQNGAAKETKCDFFQ